MRLEEFLRSRGSWPVELNEVAADTELVRDLQGQLSLTGMLDPGPDGRCGPVTEWALSTFATKLKLPSQGFSRELAQALLDPGIGAVFRLNFAQDVASKILQAMQRRGYWIAQNPACVNIIYVEGMNFDGTPNGNAANVFNDPRIIITIGKDGSPTMKPWEATTEPGRYYTEHPEWPSGVARIAFGQYKSWIVGIHRVGSPSAHEALVQVDDVTVYRDLNEDYQRDGDQKETGIFGINQHWGYDLPKADIGNASAGCLVGRSKDGHREFMQGVKSDARYLANNGYRFMTTIMPVSALDEPGFDLASPH